MGTRADFYVRREAEPLAPSDWVGSIAWDGDSIPSKVSGARTEADFRAALKEMAAERDDWTAPSDGWPWPWETSDTTDCAYVFSGDKVSSRKVKYPDMTSLQNVTLGKRSGLIVVSS